MNTEITTTTVERIQILAAELETLGKTALGKAVEAGNLLRECKVTERLVKAAQNEIINIVTILLGLAVGSKLAAGVFLNLNTLGIIGLGLIAFSIGTAGGVLLAKFMNLFSKRKINPLIGSAGVSAVTTPSGSADSML
jgi:oxaloacetate decarboxylase beta subunit